MAEGTSIHTVDRITKPMLVFQAANDVRRKLAGSDHIVEAIQARGISACEPLRFNAGSSFKPASPKRAARAPATHPDPCPMR